MTRLSCLAMSRPLLPAVLDHLCAAWHGGALDLSHLVAVVPTAEAGRRLREALAERAAARGTAVLSPHIITPELVTSWAVQEMPAPATPAEELLTWMQVLLDLPLDEYGALFPVEPATRDAAWARGTAAELLRLRHRLEEGGRNIAEAARTLGAAHIEAARWRDLARVETLAVTALHKAGLHDPLAARITAAAQPVLPPGVTGVMVLAVPDPVHLVVQALENLERQGVPVEVVVQGDQSDLTDQSGPKCDAWGRPSPEHWSTCVIDIPAAEERIRLVARPEDEATALLDALRDDHAIGSADASVAAPLLDAAARAEVDVFDPNGQPLAAHEISWLLACLTNLLRTDSAQEAARLLRVPEVLRAANAGVSAAALLRDWDEFQQQHLPRTLSDAAGLSQHWKARRSETVSPLHGVLAWLLEQCRALRRGSDVADLHALLDLVCAGKSFADDQQRALFSDALDQWREALDATAQAAARTGVTADAVVLLETAAHLLRDARLYPDNEHGAPELSGWLELPWQPAPHLTVAGLNEGFAPDGVTGDPWLPDSVRTPLDLKTNATRLARDSFLLTALIESRRENGSVTLLAARESTDGDPLKPSRLLLRCPEEQLAARALRLFPDGIGEAPRPSPPSWHRAWALRPPAPERDDAARGVALIEKISVTQFADYLACPFRFYLKHILRMEPFDAARDEMDPRDFGSLIHDTLQALHEDETLRHSADESLIAAFLDDKIQELTARRYGRNVALPLVVQLESARNRLRKLAEIHAAERAAGWRVEFTEVSFPELPGNGGAVELEGVKISGRIDLIERRADTAQRRVIDYKTSAKGSKPAEAHLKKLTARDDVPAWQVFDDGDKPQRWINLQLPLYAWIVSRLEGCSGGAEAGYINLPPALSETAVNMWPELTDAMIASAVECARGVIRSIKAGIFWPPARRLEHDDFQPLVFGSVEESFDPALLEEFRKLQQ
jgi:ATP-dependent helicase/nuclease subunit B